METQRICPSCQKPLAPDAPLGLCPECLIKSGLSPGTDPGDPTLSTAGFVPPSVADIARLFPQLEIIDLIGKGGMGAVYKARQPNLDRFVALKILPPSTAGDPGFAERFNREARALARLSHPNIVTIHDFGRVEGLHYLIMEYVDGGNLRQVEATGRLAPEQALAIVPQICDALQFAHNEGIVHRDIKPENLLMDKKGRVKITDFGIAKILGVGTQHAPLTGARDVVGTPHYMAPEQLEKPQMVDHRADIYSLGVVFYEMLTGELPLGRFSPPSRKVHVDVRLDEVVLQALEKEPQLRYQQASQVKTAVETIAASPLPGAAPGASAGAPKSSAPPINPEALEAKLLAGDYDLNIRNCLRRGWALVESDFWATVGVTALIMALVWAVENAHPIFNYHRDGFNATLSLGVLLGGPLMGGLYLLFLKRIRGEPIRVENAFGGFSNRFVQLFLATLVSEVLLVVAFICLVLPFVYFLVAWMFTLPLVIDKRIDFWPAMRLSRKVVSKHWWKFFGFGLVLLLFNLAGVLALCIGLFVTVPVSLAALMYAYEDVFSAPESRGLSPAPGSSPVPRISEGPESLVQRPIIVAVLAVAFVVVCASSALQEFASWKMFLAAFAAAIGFAFTAVVLAQRSQPSNKFLVPFLVAFMAIFGAGSFITAMTSDTFISTARVNLTPGAPDESGSNQPPAVKNLDPVRLQTEREVIQSEAILGPVIDALDLNEKWGNRYGGGHALKRAETLALLRQKLVLRPVGHTSIFEISVYGDNSDEPAKIANQIAEAYHDHNSSDNAPSGSYQVEVIDRASPALHPIRPRRGLNLTLAAIGGLILGTVAGVAGARKPL